MKPGDIVTIYFVDHRPGSDGLVDTIGLFVKRCGHKAEILVGGIMETWDISDLVKMRKSKNESR